MSLSLPLEPKLAPWMALPPPAPHFNLMRPSGDGNGDQKSCYELVPHGVAVLAVGILYNTSPF
jgi:hypothetical protein